MYMFVLGFMFGRKSVVPVFAFLMYVFPDV